jgi:hypothetical protein
MQNNFHNFNEHISYMTHNKYEGVKMTTEQVNLSYTAINTIFSEISAQLHEIRSKINNMEGISIDLNKRYITPQDVEDRYGVKKSLQAKLRMDKEDGPPYVRPSGSRVVLYNRKDFENWLEEWRAL